MQLSSIGFRYTREWRIVYTQMGDLRVMWGVASFKMLLHAIRNVDQA